MHIETAFVANAKGTVVVMTGMNTLDGLWQQGNHVAIHLDVVVIGGLAEAGIARGNEACDGEGLIAAAAGAVDNQQLHVLRFEGLQIFVHFIQN